MSVALRNGFSLEFWVRLFQDKGTIHGCILAFHIRRATGMGFTDEVKYVTLFHPIPTLTILAKDEIKFVKN